MGILVEDGGILTTVQDAGRFGYQQYGVSPAGPMDQKAFYLSNILVGNPREEGALEITFQGPKLRFEADNIIAVTGGDLSPKVNDQTIPMCQAILVKSGDVLSFAGMKNGCRGYIAFAGGLEIPAVMGSKATLLRNNLGGMEGRKLQKGDKIGFSAPKSNLPNMDRRRVSVEKYDSREIVLRVVPGPQDDCFSREGTQKFYWNSAVISNEFDRMGCRLECDPIPHMGDGNIISDGIAFGSIQVPTNGKPIIMLADRQTTGGYTKIGTVASVDLPKLVQAMPGCKVRFVCISIELAQLLYNRQYEELKNLENLLKDK